jgi:hypothetical protein
MVGCFGSPRQTIPPKAGAKSILQVTHNNLEDRHREVENMDRCSAISQHHGHQRADKGRIAAPDHWGAINKML